MFNEPGSQGQNKGKGDIKQYMQRCFDSNRCRNVHVQKVPQSDVLCSIHLMAVEVIKMDDIKLLKCSAETSGWTLGDGSKGYKRLPST